MKWGKVFSRDPAGNAVHAVDPEPFGTTTIGVCGLALDQTADDLKELPQRGLRHLCVICTTRLPHLEWWFRVCVSAASTRCHKW